jgi:predicted  nucleic acid-binding Zn-ribbon protein
MKKDSLINDLFSKCTNLNYEINEKINDLRKGSNMISALDKIKEKISEKIDNLHESIKLLEREINELTITSQSSLLWKK